MRARIRAALVAMLLATGALLVPGSAHAAAGSVTVGGQSRTLDGTDVYRAANYLVRYTSAYGASTGTNAFGFEAEVVGGKITRIENGIGNMAIPSGGYVLSGHGTARTWLQTYAKVGVGVTIGSEPPPPPPPPPPPASWVTVGGLSHQLTGTDVARVANSLVRYTPAFGASTGTNSFGFEAAVVNGVVSTVENRVGSMAIPASGFVLSAHGTSASWLQANAVVGATVTLSQTQPPPGADPELPDIGVRTLRRFSIANVNGRRLLKFPAVTVNVGNGPLEIRASRSSSGSTDWVGRQVVRNTDGSTTTLPPSAATFYYAGDGHTHWHIRDFDLYQLLDATGTQVKLGEKHGFCFEDNTGYRDWVGSRQHPEVPTSPVYTHDSSCGEGHPEATTIVHGLSVGWGDTYPETLPDQGIDITGLPDGDYTVKVAADWQHFWAETNEANNAASARIRITGTTVSMLSATDGL